MKILFLSCWYPTPEQPYKGVFIHEHAAALTAQGHEVVVLALDVSYSRAFYKKKYTHYTDANAIDTHLIQISSRFYKGIYANIPLMYKYLSACYSEKVRTYFRPDLVHSNVLNPCAIIGRRLARKLKLPHIITEHWSKVQPFMEKNVFARLGRRAYAEASAITCVSAFLARSIESYVENKARIHIVPNVVEADIFTYAPKPPKDTIVFTAVASWYPPKRPELFMEALENLAKKNQSTFELHLFGEGPQLEEYRARQNELPFRLLFHGYCNKKEIAAQLQQSHFFLHASDVETFSIVVAEALASGTPVIASNAGALPELVKAHCGVLCKNGPADWESGIEAALNTVYDYASISAEYNPKFSRENIGRMFTSIYKNALQNEGRNAL